MPTSCMASHPSIHSPTVTFPPPGVVQRPSLIPASWSRPQGGAAALFTRPVSVVSVPFGSLSFTRHGRGPLPRFSAYANGFLLPLDVAGVLSGVVLDAGPGWAAGGLVMRRRCCTAV